MRTRFFAVALWALLVPVVANATCGAEGCPLVLNGTIDQRWSFDLRYQAITQDKLWNGSAETNFDAVAADPDHNHEIEQLTRTRSWVLEAQGRLLPSLTLRMSVPYLKREHRHSHQHHPGFFEEAQWEYQGLGDATAMLHWSAYRTPSGFSASVLGGAKLATGKRNVEKVDGVQPEPAARLGSGSNDLIAGLSLSQRLPWTRSLPLTASVLQRLTTKGTDDYRVGDEFQAGLASGVRVASGVTLLAQANFGSHASDTPGPDEAEEAPHSGGRAIFVSPGVRFDLRGVSLYALYQARVWQRSDEPALVAPYHLLFGTSYALGR